MNEFTSLQQDIVKLMIDGELLDTIMDELEIGISALAHEWNNIEATMKEFVK